jgi:hypothetical protein
MDQFGLEILISLERRDRNLVIADEPPTFSHAIKDYLAVGVSH